MLTPRAQVGGYWRQSQGSVVCHLFRSSVVCPAGLDSNLSFMGGSLWVGQAKARAPGAPKDLNF